MKKDETRKMLLGDIDTFRAKAKYYKSLRLIEADKYADNLASNLELALTTMPSGDFLKFTDYFGAISRL